MKVKDLKLGATGNFPRGHADEHDEGELRMAITTDRANAIVRIVFGKSITWLGLPAADARQFAKMLTDKADELDRMKA